MSRTTVTLLKIGVLASGGALLYFTRPVESKETPRTPPSPNHPMIVTPAPGGTVKAGIVEFSGVGKPGTKLEILSNGKIVAYGWVGKDRQWKATGKVLGPGETPVFVRTSATLSYQSPTQRLNVQGQVPQTLFVTAPSDDQFLDPGTVNVAGTAAPGDDILVSYNGRAVAKAKAASNGKWSTSFRASHPSEQGEVRAISKAQKEIVNVVVKGHG